MPKAGMTRRRGSRSLLNFWPRCKARSTWCWPRSKIGEADCETEASRKDSDSGPSRLGVCWMWELRASTSSAHLVCLAVSGLVQQGISGVGPRGDFRKRNKCRNRDADVSGRERLALPFGYSRRRDCTANNTNLCYARESYDGKLHGAHHGNDAGGARVACNYQCDV